MELGLPVKDILYREISKITEKKIQIEISKNKSSKIISEIISKCIPKITQISHNMDEDLGILAESLMHFLLTIAIIPSQRKVSLGNLEIDIVIPDLKTLQKNPKDSLIIIFPKTNNKELIQKKITGLEKIQTVKENIWIVLTNNLKFKNKTFIINNDKKSLNGILDEISEFYSSRKQTKFKIIKS